MAFNSCEHHTCIPLTTWLLQMLPCHPYFGADDETTRAAPPSTPWSWHAVQLGLPCYHHPNRSLRSPTPNPTCTSSCPRSWNGKFGITIKPGLKSIQSKLVAAKWRLRSGGFRRSLLNGRKLAEPLTPHLTNIGWSMSSWCRSWRQQPLSYTAFSRR